MAVKEEILKLFMLEPNRSWTGPELADRFQVSRNAIWKAVKNLQETGYQISNQPGQGYRLDQLTQAVDGPQIVSQLPFFWRGLEVFAYEEVSSTNDLAKEYAISQPKRPALFVARSQSAGRGRYGKQFYSQLRDGLYFSLVLPPHLLTSHQPTELTLMVAVAMTRALKAYLETADGLAIKWVNDLFYQGKKVAGILSEATWNVESAELSAIIVGIGLNLAGDLSALPPELQRVVGTLFGAELPPTFNPNTLLLVFLEQLAELLATSDSAYLADYQDHLLGLHQRVTYTYNKKRYEGIMRGIDQNGHLLVETSSGQIQALNSGEISLGSEQFIV